MKPPATAFDRVARDYDAELNRGLALTGETRDFYARRRIAFLQACLARQNSRPRLVMDYGCGTGDTVPLLAGLPGVERVVGVDVSEESLAVARERHGGEGRSFLLPADARVDAAHPFDLVYTNGVFHHIEPADRPAAVRWIAERLRPGGLLAFWENNPWNPGTRWIMSRVPFDADAQPLSAPTARRLLRESGFTVLRADFHFVFPHGLRWLRWLERPLRRLPLGGQYQVLVSGN
ncbi:MAG: methyltransferase domain-containing protein [Verrucomicrobiales bacterium]|nr:methyltransferase domain-containing protein [Verrucomicrobiales bacterium]